MSCAADAAALIEKGPTAFVLAPPGVAKDEPGGRSERTWIAARRWSLAPLPGETRARAPQALATQAIPPNSAAVTRASDSATPDASRPRSLNARTTSAPSS